MRTKALLFSGFFFSIIALMHLIRLFFPFTVIINEFTIPIWFSAVGFVLAGMISAWMFYSLNEY